MHYLRARAWDARGWLHLARTPLFFLQVERVLQTADQWQFDAFELAAATGGRPLSALAFYVLKTSGLVSCLSIHASTMARWVLGCGLQLLQPWYPPCSLWTRGLVFALDGNIMQQGPACLI